MWGDDDAEEEDEDEDELDAWLRRSASKTKTFGVVEPTTRVNRNADGSKVELDAESSLFEL